MSDAKSAAKQRKRTSRQGVYTIRRYSAAKNFVGSQRKFTRDYLSLKLVDAFRNSGLLGEPVANAPEIEPCEPGPLRRPFGSSPGIVIDGYFGTWLI